MYINNEYTTMILTYINLYNLTGWTYAEINFRLYNAYGGKGKLSVQAS